MKSEVSGKSQTPEEFLKYLCPFGKTKINGIWMQVGIDKVARVGDCIEVDPMGGCYFIPMMVVSQKIANDQQTTVLAYSNGKKFAVEPEKQKRRTSRVKEDKTGKGRFKKMYGLIVALHELDFSNLNDILTWIADYEECSTKNVYNPWRKIVDIFADHGFTAGMSCEYNPNDKVIYARWIISNALRILFDSHEHGIFSTGSRDNIKHWRKKFGNAS